MNSPAERSSFIHHVGLNLYGGLQTHFFRFSEYSRQMYGYRNSVWLERSDVHCTAQTLLLQNAHIAIHPKYLGKVKVPGWPGALRKARRRQLFRAAGAHTGVIWNGFSRVQVARDMKAHGLRCFYWEHGAVWDSHHRKEKARAFWDELDGVFCNSNAARRMLQLRWDCPMPVSVCLNGVAGNLRKAPARVRSAPTNRPFRFGTAGHVRTYKGGHIAIAGLAELGRRGIDAELWIAGTGPKREEMEFFAKRLGVDSRVRFCGFVADMQGFYDDLDCYVHVAIREPFGLVAAEAMLAGCPVIASRIDGLPEVVTHEETGLCIVPKRELDELGLLETEIESRVDCAYDPVADAVISPRFVDPSDLADALMTLIDDPARLEAFSRNAINDANDRLSFERHVERVHEVLTT